MDDVDGHNSPFAETWKERQKHHSELRIERFSNMHGVYASVNACHLLWRDNNLYVQEFFILVRCFARIYLSRWLVHSEIAHRKSDRQIDRNAYTHSMHLQWECVWWEHETCYNIFCIRNHVKIMHWLFANKISSQAVIVYPYGGSTSSNAHIYIHIICILTYACHINKIRIGLSTSMRCGRYWPYLTEFLPRSSFAVGHNLFVCTEMPVENGAFLVAKYISDIAMQLRKFSFRSHRKPILWWSKKY